MADIISHIFKSVKSSVLKIHRSKKYVKALIFSVFAITGILLSFTFTGARIAYKVNYSGSMIATVSRKQQFSDALNIVAEKVCGSGIKTAVEKPEFDIVLTLNNNINSTDEVAAAIISNTDTIVNASVLKINGETTLKLEKETLALLLKDRLNAFADTSSECKSNFVADIKVEDGYFLESELDKLDKAQEVVNSLDVITEIRQVTEVVVPYKTTVQKSNEHIVGFEEITVSGVSGVDRITQDIVTLNGEVQSCTDVSTETVVAPVNEIIVKGTAKSLASAKQKQTAHSAGFVFPVPDGVWRVSSYYGDGRGHKGIDICAKSGTSIFAVANGKVVYSGWKGDYGNCVIIEHSNGMRTLYGHAKQLCCNVGDTVSQGEVIALVGTTGQSSGNHIHFEVIVNGKNVDPAPYINLD